MSHNTDVISPSVFRQIMDCISNIWQMCFDFLDSFYIAGLSLLQILLGILVLSLLFIIIHNLAVGGK